MEAPEAIKAEISQLDQSIRRRFAEIDERWNEFKSRPDAVLGEQIKRLSDANAQDFDRRAKEVENAMQKRQDEFEVKMAEKASFAGSANPAADAIKTLNSWAFDGRTFKERSTVELPLKAVTNITSDLLPDTGSVVQGIRELPQAPLLVRNLVPTGTIDGYYFKYERETAGSQEGDAGYQTTEGSVKPSMDIYTEVISDEVATIAVTARVSAQTMADRPAFASWLRVRMGYRVERYLDRQMLAGAGTSGTLTGINTVATAFDATLDTAAAVASQQRLDVLRLARLQVELQDFMADGVILHPTDWAGLELLKDAEGRYLISSATSGAPGRVWGMPVVATTGQTQGTFTVGDFRLGAQLFIREGLTILASTEDQDNFVKNLVTIRAELRALQAIYSTTAFVKGTYTAALA